MTSKKLNILSVGSLTPELGGSTVGGVANIHEALLQGFQCFPDLNINVVGVIGNNVKKNDNYFIQETIPVFCPPDVSAKERGPWYQQLLKTLNPNIVVFHHIGHQWTDYHIQYGSDIPFVGITHSWHQITFHDPDTATKRRFKVQQALSHADALISASKHTFAEALELNLQLPSRTKVIPNPYNSIFENGDLSLRDEDTPPKILFVANLIPRKRPDIVIQAAAQLGIPLIIAGDGPERTNLEHLVKTLDYEANVEFVGFQDSSDILRLLSQVSVLCIPSQSESFAVAYLEALACGVPVIGHGPTLSEVSDWLDIEVGIGLSPDASVEELCQAIRYVLGKNWDRCRLSSQARKTFSPAKIAAEYAQFLHQLVLKTQLTQHYDLVH